jgi:hypothetical protein
MMVQHGTAYRLGKQSRHQRRSGAAPRVLQTATLQIYCNPNTTALPRAFILPIRAWRSPGSSRSSPLFLVVNMWTLDDNTFKPKNEWAYTFSLNLAFVEPLLLNVRLCAHSQVARTLLRLWPRLMLMLRDSAAITGGLFYGKCGAASLRHRNPRDPNSMQDKHGFILTSFGELIKGWLRKFSSPRGSVLGSAARGRS